MMSEYSIQFWVMIGTLITAGGTLLLGLGVLLAWMQLKQSREADRQRDEYAGQGKLLLAAQSLGQRPWELRRESSSELVALSNALTEFLLACRASGAQVHADFMIYEGAIALLFTNSQIEQDEILGRKYWAAMHQVIVQVSLQIPEMRAGKKSLLEVSKAFEGVASKTIAQFPELFSGE